MRFLSNTRMPNNNNNVNPTKSSSSSVPHVPVTINERNIPQEAVTILKIVRPKWIVGSIKSKVFTDGLSNKLVGFWVESDPEDVVIVKVFGSHTDILIDRKAEIATMRILHDSGCGAQLYATFNNGICYEYMNGSIIEIKDCKDPNIYPLIAAEMARMHSSYNDNNNGNKFTNASCPLWEKMWRFYGLAVEAMKNDVKLEERLAVHGFTAASALKALEQLEQLLKNEEMPVVFCHNDLIHLNIVHDQKRKRITFIDIEYAMPNYPGFDVANHFLEFAGVPELDYTQYPDKEFRLKWITEYLKNLRLGSEEDYSASKITVDKFSHWVDMCVPASHLFWTLWSVHQARYSTINFDYSKYAGKRFSEFKECMKRLTLS